MSKHLAGKKFSKRHTTVIDAAMPLVQTAQTMPAVTKIVLGIIKPAKHGPHRVKLVPISGGIKATVRGGIYVQEIFLYTKELASVMERIAAMISAGNK